MTNEVTQAEQAAWQAGIDEGRSQLQSVAVPDGGTPGLWSVCKREVDGELRDCFVTAPDCQGLPYDAEILGDDEYRDDNGIARKLADCELIVAAVNAYRAALAATPVQGVVLPEPVKFAIDRFDAYFRSANGVPPNARTSVPTSEWQALRALLATGGQAQAVERGEVLVTVSGFTGSGKSAIAGEIEILCRALGLQVEWPDSDSEKHMTHADWTAALEQYKPRVHIVEQNIPFAAMKGMSK